MGCGASSNTRTPHPASPATATATAVTSSAAATQGEAATEVVLADVGAVLAGTTSVIDVASSSLSFIGDSLATQNADGSWTLNAGIGPIPLDNPFLRSVATKIVYACGSALNAIDGGASLVTVLTTIYSMWMSSHTKPQWLGEFLLYLKSVESEVCGGLEQFRRRGFLLLVADEIESVRPLVSQIRDRGTLASFIFAGTDQDTLEEARDRIDALKQQAVAGMIGEVKEDTSNITASLRDIVADLKAQRDAQWNTSAQSESVRAELAKSRMLPKLLSPLRFDAEITASRTRFCTGTRQEILDDFRAWSRLREEWLAPHDVDEQRGDTQHAQRVFFLEASPGMGKTMVAGHIAATFASAVHAMHFCSLAVPTRADPRRAIKSLLYQLATTIPALRTWLLARLSDADGALEQRLRGDPHSSVVDLFEETIGEGLRHIDSEARRAVNEARERGQANPGLAACTFLPQCVTGDTEVVTEPISSVGGDTDAAPADQQPTRLPPSKMILLIDALDECSSRSGAQTNDDLIALLSDTRVLSRLPSWVGFVVTSRPDDRIAAGLARFPTRRLDSNASGNVRDLDLYVRSIVARLIRPTEDAAEATTSILHRCDGNFAYASMMLAARTTLTLAEASAPPAALSEYCLQLMHRVRTHAEAYGLDADVDAESALDQLPSHPSWSHTLWIMRFVAAAHKHALRIDALPELMRVSADTIAVALSPLRSILAMQSTPLPPSDEIASSTPSPPTVLLFHPALRDWLVSDDRQQDDAEIEFHVDLTLSELDAVRHATQM